MKFVFQLMYLFSNSANDIMRPGDLLPIPFPLDLCTYAGIIMMLNTNQNCNVS